MDEDYELQTHKVEEDHWWYRGRRRIITDVVRGLDMPVGTRILDAGCGSGRNMVELAAFGDVTGLELADASVERARSRAVGAVAQGSVDAIPFDAASFDLAVSLDVIEHLPDDRPALGELRRVVRPGGTLLVTVPAYQWLWSEHDVINHHRRRYNVTTLTEAATDAGWTVARTTYFNGFLLPIAIAYRGLSRLRRISDDPTSDLERTPGWLNQLLERPLLAEARIISRGRRLPAGLSLMAVLH
jgi:SAM-dependent methyltransferase